MKSREQYKNDAEILRNEIEDQGISQQNFATQYFLDEVNKKAGRDELSDHYDRFKKVLNNKDMRSPERIYGYINYFNRRYKSEGKYTQADRHAAWQMFIELDTRIATRTLKDGVLSSALDSLAALFSLHREISKDNGPNCKQYYESVTECFEHDLRPFTSKWHGKALVNEDNAFRTELINLQKKMIELKLLLWNISK